MDEVTEIKGASIEFVQSPEDSAIVFPETTELKGFAIEFELTEAEKIVQETTIIKGFAIEYVQEKPLEAAFINTRRK